MPTDARHADAESAAAIRAAAEQLNGLVDAAHHCGLQVELQVFEVNDASRGDPPPMVYPVVSRRV